MGVETFLILLGLASLVAVAARRFQVPYTIALVLTGLALGSSGLFRAPALTHELLFSLVLPALIYEAAYHLDARDVWLDRLAINGMATPGLVFGMAVTAAILVPTVSALGLAHGFTWLHGLVFASIIGATDPIAVVALFKSLQAPQRLRVIVEAESLLNDGTGVVVFTIAVGAVAGTEGTLASAVVDFVRVVGLGAAIGVAAGYAAEQLLRRVDDAMIEVTFTVISAFGSFLLADRLGGSGVIATLVAGMWSGNRSAKATMSLATRTAVSTFWEYVAFTLNSVVFLLLGFEVHLGTLVASWMPVLAAYLAATIARFALVYGTSLALARTSARVPPRWAFVISWSGLRGALSMVLALSLPAAFPHRELMVNMTFGVVLLTILVQGSTMGTLLRRLKLGPGNSREPGVVGLL